MIICNVDGKVRLEDEAKLYDLMEI